MAFLRRAYRIQNETWERYLFPWLRVKPSTPAAEAPVVILTDKYQKEEMDEILKSTLAERGINPQRTCVGWDIICRHGDPTAIHDLVRVRAHEATCIVLMNTEKDTEEAESSGGKVRNGGTMRGLLALRHVLFANKGENGMLQDDAAIRIVVQLSEPSKYVEAAQWLNSRHPSNPNLNSNPNVKHSNLTPASTWRGQEVVMPMDLSVFINSLLFSCAQQPGLAKVLLELLNFDGTAIRCRPVEVKLHPLLFSSSHSYVSI